MDQSRSPEEALPAPAPRLRAEDEDGAAGFVPLRLVLQPSGVVVEMKRADVLVGRHSDADVRLSLPDVSRRHCRLVCADGRWEVVDLKSLNGIFVNDEPVQRAPLRQGDLIRIGGFTFAVDLSGRAHDGEPAPADGHLRSIVHALPPPDADEQRRRAS
jgi:pSer/pThr/pTyr-binding forkhead associated (FHA) protein